MKHFMVNNVRYSISLYLFRKIERKDYKGYRTNAKVIEYIYANLPRYSISESHCDGVLDVHISEA